MQTILGGNQKKNFVQGSRLRKKTSDDFAIPSFNGNDFLDPYEINDRVRHGSFLTITPLMQPLSGAMNF
jgi:hypothetical protein